MRNLIGNSFEIIPCKPEPKIYQTMTDSEWAERAKAIEDECWERDAQWWNRQ